MWRIPGFEQQMLSGIYPEPDSGLKNDINGRNGGMMSTKSLMMILISLVTAFVIVVGGFIVVYKFFPGFIGIDRKSNQERTMTSKSKSKKNVPNITISKTEFDELIRESVRNKILVSENKQLLNNQKNLADSLSKKNELLSTGKTSYPKMLDSIAKIHGIYAKLRDSLQKVTLLYKQVLSDIDRITKTSQEKEKLLLGQLDSIKNKNLSDFAKIYDNSEPKDVAKILEKIDSKDASKILKLMSKKKAGKVLEAISTERAAEIMRQGSQR
ncbi:MAG: hypothetical protein EPN82_15070 [Bacteroidetes bacterium]|nr:MAG: hypothetical protein EPN82_15070 [Bacteroidota bacterium]